jgi:acetyl esterase/lipase
LAGADPRHPLYTPDDELASLAKLLIQVGTRESLLDDSRRFVARATAAGADVTYIEHVDGDGSGITRVASGFRRGSPILARIDLADIRGRSSDGKSPGRAAGSIPGSSTENKVRRMKASLGSAFATISTPGFRVRR